MAPLQDLIRFLDDLLEPDLYVDYGPNGLQVPSPRTEVGRVVTGVSATRAFIDRGIAAHADLLLVHHGLFWGPANGLDFLVAERLRPLFRADVALAAYHLPLDGHAKVGNNALLAQALGCESHESWLPYGRVGRFEGEGISIEELVARVRDVTGGRDPLHLPGGPESIRTIGIVSGGAAKHVIDAGAAGFDAFLTGEPREPAMGEAAESGVHFLAAGHYATETFGIRRLGELLASEFGVEHNFIDLPNPI